jgi:archaemetzincin
MTISSEGWFGLKAITIIPIGSVESRILNQIASQLEKNLQIKVDLGDELPIPKDSFNTKRNQYYATEILSNLKSTHPFHLGPILGVIEGDIYIPEFNFIFGEADPISEVAIMSLKRLRQEFYDLKPDNNLFMDRAVKEALHEIGHVYGLGHCINQSCTMHFSNTLQDTDKKGSKLCENCRTKINLRK